MARKNTRTRAGKANPNAMWGGRYKLGPADLLVVCDAPFGSGNVENLRLALEAARAGIRIVLLEQIPMSERDFTGGVAGELWPRRRTGRGKSAKTTTRRTRINEVTIADQ